MASILLKVILISLFVNLVSVNCESFCGEGEYFAQEMCTSELDAVEICKNYEGCTSGLCIGFGEEQKGITRCSNKTPY